MHVTFNQSKLLAEELAKLMNVEVIDIFEKTSDTKSQKTSTFFGTTKKCSRKLCFEEQFKFCRQKYFDS